MAAHQAPAQDQHPRLIVDSFLFDYLNDVYLARDDVPDAARALTHVQSLRSDLNMDLCSLYWSTQSKFNQLYVRLNESPHGMNFSNQVEHFLCVKCGTWVPNHSFEQHLSLGELTRYLVASPAHSHMVPDCSYHCRLSHRHHDSRAEKNYWHVHHLVKHDWPTFCQECHCMLMRSTIPLHSQSFAFCRHARKTIAANSGLLTRSRFSHYPGHPLTHLYYVGRWPVASLATLYDKELEAKTMLFINYNRILALSLSLYGFFELDVPVLRLVLTFLCHKRCAEFVQYAELLDSVLELVLDGKVASAKRLVCLYARTSMRNQQSDRFGLSMFSA